MASNDPGTWQMGQLVAWLSARRALPAAICTRPFLVATVRSLMDSADSLNTTGQRTKPTAKGHVGGAKRKSAAESASVSVVSTSESMEWTSGAPSPSSSSSSSSSTTSTQHKPKRARSTDVTSTGPRMTHHTNITERYNRTWVPDVREFVQNAIDGLHLTQLQRQGHLAIRGPDSSGTIAVYDQRNPSKTLLQVDSGDSSLTLTQWMPARTRLQRSALLLHSDKKFASGDIGGFGEGLKIGALQLLKSGYSVQYDMYQERWVFRLEKRAELGGAAELVVDIYPVEEQTDSTLIITVQRVKPQAAKCSTLFNPRKYLLFSPREVLLRRKNCEFLRERQPSEMAAAGDEKQADTVAACDVYVNGILLKQSKSVSLSVNIALPVQQLSPDRDCLRVDECDEVRGALLDLLKARDGTPGKTLVQQLLYDVLEASKGQPRSDLKGFTLRDRHLILPHMRRLYGDPKAHPIRRGANAEQYTMYKVLGRTPWETDSAQYFTEGEDLLQGFGRQLKRLPEVVPPPQCTDDLEALKAVVEFINAEMSAHRGSVVAVRFVTFPVAIGEAIRYHNTIFLPAQLYNADECAKLYPQRDRFQTWLTLLMSKVLFGFAVSYVKSALLSHLQEQLMCLVLNRKHKLMGFGDRFRGRLNGGGGGGASGNSSSSSSSSSNNNNHSPGGTGSVSAGHVCAPPTRVFDQEFAPADNKHDAYPSVLRDRLQSQSHTVPQLVGDQPGTRAPPVGPDVDDRVPLMHPVTVSYRTTSGGTATETIYTDRGQKLPANLLPQSKLVRHTMDILDEAVFADLSYTRHYCYFPSDVMGFYSPKTRHIFINLFFAQRLADPKALFLLMCHEMAHACGKSAHNTHFADCMAALVVHYSTAFNFLYGVDSQQSKISVQK